MFFQWRAQLRKDRPAPRRRCHTEASWDQRRISGARSSAVHGAAPEVNRRARKSSRTVTRVDLGPPAGVIRCSARFAADHSSSTVSSRPSRTASQTIKSGCSAYTAASFQRKSKCLGVGCAERPLHGDRLLGPVGIGEPPGLAGRKIQIAEARMVAQIARVAGPAMPGEIAGRANHQAAHRTKPAGDQAGVPASSAILIATSIPPAIRSTILSSSCRSIDTSG